MTHEDPDDPFNEPDYDAALADKAGLTVEGQSRPTGRPTSRLFAVGDSKGGTRQALNDARNKALLNGGAAASYLSDRVSRGLDRVSASGTVGYRAVMIVTDRRVKAALAAGAISGVAVSGAAAVVIWYRRESRGL